MRLEPPPEAGRHGDRRMLGIPAGGEGVRDVGVDDRHARLGEAGHRTEPLHHCVQLRRLLGRDDLRAGSRERELVRGVVLEDGDADDDDEQRGKPDVEEIEEGNSEDDVEQAQQAAREEHPQGEPPVAAK